MKMEGFQFWKRQKPQVFGGEQKLKNQWFDIVRLHFQKGPQRNTGGNPEVKAELCQVL